MHWYNHKQSGNSWVTFYHFIILAVLELCYRTWTCGFNMVDVNIALFHLLTFKHIHGKINHINVFIGKLFGADIYWYTTNRDKFCDLPLRIDSSFYYVFFLSFWNWFKEMFYFYLRSATRCKVLQKRLS